MPYDLGAQGDKTITLLYPRAHYQPQSQICSEPSGCSTTGCSLPPVALCGLEITGETHRFGLTNPKRLTASFCGREAALNILRYSEKQQRYFGVDTERGGLLGYLLVTCLYRIPICILF